MNLNEAVIRCAPLHPRTSPLLCAVHPGNGVRLDVMPKASHVELALLILLLHAGGRRVLDWIGWYLVCSAPFPHRQKACNTLTK